MNRITEQLELVRADDLHDSESEFRRRHPLIWGGTLYGPLVLTLVIIILLFLFHGWMFTQKVLGFAVLALFLIGRFIILSGSDGSFQDTTGSLTSSQLFLIVTYLDIAFALVLAFHIGFLFKVPFIGGFPLAATGSVGGSIFGRLLGMSRISTFVGILIGTLIGNGSMYYFSDLMGKYLDKDDPYLKIGGFIVIATIVIILERRYRKLRDRYAANEGVAKPTEENAA
jgi:hypothetical protein